jgi:N6-L-threonylcarbamoyladenine synthase
MSEKTLILGIESSCDDTAAAVLCASKDTVEILSSVVLSQTDLHSAFGGVVPEIAARAHVEKLDIAVKQSLDQASVSLNDLSAIAVTSGPGLIGGVLSGVMLAKGLSAACGIPLIGVNHLAGHALTPRLCDETPYPYLMLLVSGGHCQFLIVRGPNEFLRLGGTIDDAPGEAFDKTARILGLPQPGGPSVEKAAKLGDPQRFSLPRPLLNRPDCDMSFSGLKTALIRARDAATTDQGLRETDRNDLCAGFQSAIADVLVAKTRRALDLYFNEAPQERYFAIAGGVAANRAIRDQLQGLCGELETGFSAPPLELCTDNAAMIAHAGLLRYQIGHRDDLTLSARPRWPLDGSSAAMLGSGKKGAKA